MKPNNLPIVQSWQTYFRNLYAYVHRQVTSPWTKLTVLAALLFVCTQKEISFNFSIASGGLFSINEASVFTHSAEGPQVTGGEAAGAKEIGEGPVFTSAVAPVSKRKWTKRQLQQLAYVERYARAALQEFKTHGIPASITLAQGLLESGHGTSTLARKNNNHFGIKCFSKKCRKGHCSNHSDDHHKDFFRNFSDAAESYAAHSQVLLKDRYKKLFRLNPRDYKGWAHGLRKAGYATDPRYGDKLIKMVEDFELWRYDRVRV